MEATLCCLLWLCFLIIFSFGCFPKKVKLQVIALWVFELLFQTNLSNLFLLVAVIIAFAEELCGPPKLHKPDVCYCSVLIGTRSISFVAPKDVWLCWRISLLRSTNIYMTFHVYGAGLPLIETNIFWDYPGDDWDLGRYQALLSIVCVFPFTWTHDKICLKLAH